MDKNISDTNLFYELRLAPHVYPVEFVVRTFLGSYPNLKLDKTSYKGSRILDIGYGDGRNMPLLFNLGFDVYGVEISDEINSFAKERLTKLGVDASLRKGRNISLPFEDGFFKFVLACHSCYYIDEGKTFEDSLNEISRVLESEGTFICSVPMHDSYILNEAEELSGGYYRITYDPYNYRKGTIFRAFASEKEIEDCFSHAFKDITVGFCDDNYYGLRQKVWIITCKKK